MKYHIITYGCQMNWSDSERIAAVLENTGYSPTSKIEDADLVVVNMCSVRQSAVDRVIGLLLKIEKLRSSRSLLTTHYKLQTILTGCILKKDKLKLAKYFDEIVDIKEFIKKTGKSYSKNIIAYVPIMTGCNNFCAYCVVPYTRGREISRSAEEIICEVKNLIENGAKEIWLLGQNVNSYGFNSSPLSSPSEKDISPTPPPPPRRGRIEKGDLKTVNFPKLLKTINDIPGNFWIRFTSPHPKDFSDELIEAMKKCEKFGEYLNLPVQAGDNQILKKMNRGYTIGQYEKLVKKIRAKIPSIALSTDVIVGFPGETKKQYDNTAKLFRKIKYDMAYINKYSSRAGAMAEKMRDNVLPKEKIRRAKVLNEILKQTALEKNKKYIGRTIEALIVESRIMNNELRILIGKTRANKTVQIHNSELILARRSLGEGGIHNSSPVGKFVKVKISEALPWGLKGDLLK